MSLQKTSIYMDYFNDLLNFIKRQSFGGKNLKWKVKNLSGFIESIFNCVLKMSQGLFFR